MNEWIERERREREAREAAIEALPLECFGHAAVRGRVMAETDDLPRAIEEASARSRSGFPDSSTWIYDRRRGRTVPADEIVAVGGRVSRLYRRFHG